MQIYYSKIRPASGTKCFLTKVPPPPLENGEAAAVTLAVLYCT